MSSRPLILDAHEDLAVNGLNLGRNLMQRSAERRQIENLGELTGSATTSFPDLLEGNVRLVFATLWVSPCGSELEIKPCYTTANEAHAQAMAQVEYYKNLEHQGVLKIIKTKSDLEEVARPDSSEIGIVLLMEGADPIRSPSEAREWFEAGVRIIGPAWGATRYSGGTRAPGPLTKEGHELMKEMDRIGYILDCSHLAEESFFEALDDFRGISIASHSNCRIYSPTDRQLTDDMIRTLTSRGGVIGVVLYNGFLDGNCQKGDPKSKVTLAQVVKNIVHIADVSLSRQHSGIGSDFDGGFGAESIPLELDTAADLYKIGDALKKQAGYSNDEATGVLGGNFVRVLRKALPG